MTCEEVEISLTEDTPVTLSLTEDTPITFSLTGTADPFDFLSLTDTPDSYTGKAGNLVQVNSTGTGLEFTTIPTVVDWGEIHGTLSNQTDLQSALDLKVPYTGATTNVNLGEHSLTATNIDLDNSYLDNTNYIDFNKDYSDGQAEARLQWNSTDGTLEFGLPGGNVNLQVGQEMLIRCKKATGQTISNGSVVYISGASGSRPEVSLADADAYSTSFVVGVSTETFTGAQGYICMEGLVRDVNTDGMTEGAPIWLSQTAGQFTTTRPTAPAMSIFLGYVVYAHASNGIIAVRPVLVPRMAGLSDTYGSPGTTGQFYKWNQTNLRFELDNVSNYEVVANKSTTVTLGTSDTLYPSQNAVKTYVDNLIPSSNALVYKGTLDCSASPNYPAADAGWLYIVSVAGKIGGASGVTVEVGDMVICNTDSTPSGDQATVGTYWNAIQKNIVGAVTGPASSTDNAVALFDSTSGKIIKNSLVTVDANGSINVPANQGVTSSGDLSLTPTAGNNLNVSLSTTGDLVVNTDQFVVDTSASRIGVGTASPLARFHVKSSTFPVGNFERTTTLNGDGSFDNINGISSGYSLRTTLNSDMVDGFGGGIILSIQDNASGGLLTDGIVSRIVGRRDGSDIKGALQFFTVGDNCIIPTMTLRSSGSVGVGTVTPRGLLDISSGGLTLVLGSDLNNTSRTNSNQKYFRIGGYHYTNNEEPMAVIYGTSSSTSNSLEIGGGTSQMNAATSINFYTAENNTTTTGTSRMVIDSLGNVGVGVITPRGTLHLGRANNSSLVLQSIGTTTGNYSAIYFKNTDALTDDYKRAAIIFERTGESYARGTLHFAVNAVEASSLNVAISDSKMAIDSSGNVGIRTVTPGSRLDIQTPGYGLPASSGSVQTYGGLRISPPPATGNICLDIGTNGVIGTWLQTVLRSDLSNVLYPLLLNPNGGKIGINTATPNAKLDVGGLITSAAVGTPVAMISDSFNGISGLEMSNRNSGTSAEFRFSISDSTGHYFSFNVPGINNNVSAIFGLNRKDADFIFNAGGTARNIGIGTADSKDLIFGTSNLERMRITSAGNVGIGITAPPATTKVYINGTTTAGDNLLYLKANASTQRLVLEGSGSSGTVQTFLEAGTTIGLFGTVSDHDFRIRTNYTDRITILGADGKVGIGTTTPTSRIHGSTTLSHASGNEAAYRLEYTTNKVAGDDTGLLINMTDTASPGTSRLLDLQVGGVSYFRVSNSGVLNTSEVNPNSINSNTATPGTSGFYRFTATMTNIAAQYVTNLTPVYSQASGSASNFVVRIAPTYNQVGTQANTDLLINRTQTAVGSGNQYLIDAQVGGGI